MKQGFCNNFLTLIVLCLGVPGSLLAQIDIVEGDTNPYTPENIIENVFTGEGVDIVDISFEGDSKAVGVFSNGSSFIGVNEGLVISTGFVRDVSMANDLQSHIGGTTSSLGITDEALEEAAGTDDLNDIAIYEISFRPVSDSVKFKYVFASEEYPQFVCSQFNDAFGFFISGPNPDGGNFNEKNIALIPDPSDSSGTTFINSPVTINHVNGGEIGVAGEAEFCEEPNGSLNYSQYYNEVPNGSFPAFNAYLDIFTASSAVVPCELYTIKIAIADGVDRDFDSAVFLEAKSFVSESIALAIQTASTDGAIVEGCQSASITIDQPSSSSSSQFLDLQIVPFGSMPNQAEPEVDYTGVPNPVVVPAGEQSVTIEIQALEDNEDEGVEFIYLTFQRNACFRDTIQIPIRERILPNLNLTDSIPICEGRERRLEANFMGALPPTSENFIFSSNSRIDFIQEGVSYNSSINVNGVTPNTLSTAIVEGVCIDTLVGRNLDIYDIFLIGPENQILELTTDNGVHSDNAICSSDPFAPGCIDTFLNTCFVPLSANNINNGNATEGPSFPANLNYKGAFAPEGDFSDFINGGTVNGIWSLLVRMDDQPSQQDLNAGIHFLRGWSLEFQATYRIDYLWSPQENGDIGCPTCPTTLISPIADKEFNLLVTDSYGCTTTDDVRVSVNPVPGTPEFIDCQILSSSDVQLSWGPVDGPDDLYYNIRIDGEGPWYRANQTTYVVPGLANNTEYMFEVRSNNDLCVSEKDTIFCMTPPCTGFPPVIDSLVITDETCPGFNNGKLDVYAFDPEGTALSYIILAWRNEDGKFNGLLPRGYEVRITDEAGCTTTDSIFVGEGTPVNYGISSLDISCNGLNDGSASVDTSGGLGPYFVQWSTNESGVNIEELSAGEYYLTVTNGIFCFARDTVQIEDPSPLFLNSSLLSEPTCGLDNGAISVIVDGGSPPFEYEWSNGDSGSEIENLESNFYEVTVTDHSGCVFNTQFQLQGDEAIGLVENEFQAVCPGSETGEVEITISGGSGPFEVFWSNGLIGEVVDNITAGNYQLTITDFKNCEYTTDVTVLPFPDVVPVFDFVVPECYSDPVGEITITSVLNQDEVPLEGYNIIWEGDIDADMRTGLLGDSTYNATVFSIDGCAYPISLFLPAPNRMEANFTIIDEIDCIGGTNGSISIAPSGGMGTIDFEWGPEVENALDNTAVGLSAGEYTVVLTDEMNCEQIESFILLEPDSILINGVISNVICFNDGTGSITLDVTGGTADYSYSWSNGDSSENLEGVAGDTYEVTVTDNNGCVETNSFTVIEAIEELTVEAIGSDAKCEGTATGEISIFPNGGIGPYQYKLDTLDFTNISTYLGLAVGEYSVEVVDSLGCSVFVENIIVGDAGEKFIELGDDMEVNLGATFSVDFDTNTDIESIEWQLTNGSDISCSNCFDPVIAKIEITSLLIVTAIDSEGCILRDEKQIIVRDESFIQVPTGFSPNGDNANDKLNVFGLPGVIIIDFNVYSRWGELVYSAQDFEVNDTNTGWDGTFKEKDMNSGTYLWTARFEQLNGIIIDVKGEVTLIR